MPSIPEDEYQSDDSSWIQEFKREARKNKGIVGGGGGGGFISTDDEEEGYHSNLDASSFNYSGNGNYKNVQCPYYDSDVDGMADEDAIVWSSDAEKAYFAFMLEQEKERRALRGKDDQDSLVGSSTLGEMQGQPTKRDIDAEMMKQHSLLDEDGALYSLATPSEPKTKSLEDPEGNKPIGSNFVEKPIGNRNDRQERGNFPQVVFLGSDKHTTGKQKMKEENTKPSDSARSTEAQNRRRRNISILVASVSCTLLAFALTMILVVFFLEINAEEPNSELSAAAANNAPRGPSFSPSLSPSVIGTLLPKKTPPPETYYEGQEEEEGEDDGEVDAKETTTTAEPTAKSSSSNNNSTAEPNIAPMWTQTTSPSQSPTIATFVVTLNPSVAQTPLPILFPTNSKPSNSPSSIPSNLPSAPPSPRPTLQPTLQPAIPPTTSQPTLPPTLQPTLRPTPRPTRPPTRRPTNRPTQAPVPLGLCEGDCDRDSDCAEDMICFQRERGDPPPVECPDIDTRTQIDFCVYWNEAVVEPEPEPEPERDQRPDMEEDKDDEINDDDNNNNDDFNDDDDFDDDDFNDDADFGGDDFDGDDFNDDFDDGEFNDDNNGDDDKDEEDGGTINAIVCWLVPGSIVC